MEANRLMPSDATTELQTPQHSYAVILLVCTHVTVSVWVMPGGKVTHCPNPATPPPKWPSCLDRKRSVMAPRSHLQSHALIIVSPSRPLLPQVAVSPPPHPPQHKSHQTFRSSRFVPAVTHCPRPPRRIQPVCD